MQELSTTSMPAPNTACVNCAAEIPKNHRVTRPRCTTCKDVHEQALQHARNERYLDRTRPNRNTDPTCVRCETVFHRVNPTGRTPSYCPPCKLEVKRRASRETSRRARAARPPVPPEVITCFDCGLSFSRPVASGRRPQRCSRCRLERARRRARARGMSAAQLARSAFLRRKRRRAAYNQAGRWNPCRGCGELLLCAFNGKPKEWCEPCRREDLKQTYWQRLAPPDPEPIACADCGALAPRLRKGRRRQRCATCARARKKRQLVEGGRRRRAAIRGRRVEFFSTVEIFHRDKWRCGLCRKKINPKLKHPHPMSASLDHMVPLSRGGEHTRANCHASHLKCNLRKHAFGGGEQLALI